MPPKRNVVRGTKRQVSGDVNTPSKCATLDVSAQVENKSAALDDPASPDCTPTSPLHFDDPDYKPKELEHRDILTIRIHYAQSGSLDAADAPMSVVQLTAYSPTVRDTDEVFDLIRTTCWSTVMAYYYQGFEANNENNWREKVARNLVLFILYDTLCEGGLSHGRFGISKLFLLKDGTLISQEDVVEQLLASYAKHRDEFMTDLCVSKILEPLAKMGLPVVHSDATNLKQQICYVKRDVEFNLYP